MGILEVKGVNKRFGGLQALGDVNLSVQENSVHAIIGPNGAGKSTLLNCLVGKLIPDTGSVMFDGQSVLGRKPYEINQMGISRVFQTPEIFGELSVMENMMIPCFAKRDGSFAMTAFAAVRNQKDIVEHAMQALEDMNMTDKRHMHSASLSRGDKRRLEIGMCLAQEPRLLLLDEPTAGMARADTNNTIDLLKEIRDTRDITIAIIEHDMHVVFSPGGTDHRPGAGSGLWWKIRPRTSKATRKCAKRTSGKPKYKEAAAMTLSDTPAYFSVRDIHAYYGESYIVQGVSFEIKEGEILASAGPKRRRQNLYFARHRPHRRSAGDPRGNLARWGFALHAMASFEASRAGLGPGARGSPDHPRPDG